MSGGNTPQTHPPGARRWGLPRVCWIVLAALCFAIGVVGIVMPLLPATDFFLLAVICASRGSKRFERWIRRNRLAGPLIRAWEEERAVPTTAKVVAVISMVLSLSLLYWHIGLHWSFWLCVGILAAVALFLLSRPAPSAACRHRPLKDD
ncbi:YbaN family protein [Larsenimonas suaedae]|uniref:YbaN family protein n=1 Tax=Larsenimonas suaedae TaxID=1851019 RepID=A0ABU1GYZ2_9GAMM|nr:YbaN family protein [Larsenimonas suaedae]MCM2971506.1 YbaN family protein [Larsenimonas suaedae]MDR5896762.1 YbaN family protein [Larsenimonas suaedae]